ncbi:MAG TPA: PIN domain-containing protein [Gemmatimonadaceae bacterium]|nr:PIN domain-containing protein [Gemmatimonadaceae bacterium]
MRPVERNVLLDTGPLVAVLDRRDQWHAGCAADLPAVLDRCLTVEAVVTEASHLVGRGGGPAHAPLDFLLTAGIPIVGLETAGLRRAASLMQQYRRIPMDFADASLVAIAEALMITTVFTTDRRGFRVYRPPQGKRFTTLPRVE